MGEFLKNIKNPWPDKRFAAKPSHKICACLACLFNHGLNLLLGEFVGTDMGSGVAAVAAQITTGCGADHQVTGRGNIVLFPKSIAFLVAQQNAAQQVVIKKLTAHLGINLLQGSSGSGNTGMLLGDELTHGRNTLVMPIIRSEFGNSIDDT